MYIILKEGEGLLKVCGGEKAATAQIQRAVVVCVVVSDKAGLRPSSVWIIIYFKKQLKLGQSCVLKYT